MADLTCVDGSVLGVLPVPVLDRDGAPYEVTLRLTRDGAAFGEVGERCGYFLAATAARMRAARADGQDFPASSLEAGLRAWARDAALDDDEVWDVLGRYVPRDRELFCFQARDPDDLAGVGMLRVTTEVERRWSDGWSVRCLAVLRAWGADGVGVSAVLDSDALMAFLDELVSDFAAVGAVYTAGEDASVLRRPVG